MKDFSGAFSGDAFAVVMEKFQCSYYMALQIIANDFGIIRRKDLTKHRPKIEYSGIKFEEKESAKIQIQTREFNENELNWWLSYGITKQTLEKFRVYPVDKAWLNNHLFYQNVDNKLVFGYYGGIKDGNELWRLYFSQRKSYKFISNKISRELLKIKNKSSTLSNIVKSKKLSVNLISNENIIDDNSELSGEDDDEIQKGLSPIWLFIYQSIQKIIL